MARLRGRPPGTCDIPDILYDLHSFQDIYMNTGELRQPLRSLVLSESLYYKLAENLAVKNAKDFGFHERLPDFIDIAKESVTRIVWINWKPEDGENFIDLHKRIIGTLRRHLVHQVSSGFSEPIDRSFWRRRFFKILIESCTVKLMGFKIRVGLCKITFSPLMY